MTRTGKIARLPREIRQTLNERLRAGETARNLVDWLNDFPVVQTIMACEFDGQPIREQNVSEWRKGGYQEWLQQENALEMAVRLGQTAERWQAAGQLSMTEMLAFWLMSQFVAATGEIAGMEGEKKWQFLNKMSANLAKLHRIEQQARKWRLEQVSSTSPLSSSGRIGQGCGGTSTQAAPRFAYATSALRAREEAQAREEREGRQPRGEAQAAPAPAPDDAGSAGAAVESVPAGSESGGDGTESGHERPSAEERAAFNAAEEARMEAWSRAQAGLKQWSAERLARFGFAPGWQVASGRYRASACGTGVSPLISQDHIQKSKYPKIRPNLTKNEK